MKRIFVFLGLLIGINPFLVNAQQIAVRLKTFKYDVNIPNYNNQLQYEYGSGLEEATSGSMLYSINGVEHIIGTPALNFTGLAPIHLINQNGAWVIENYYKDAAMGNARNYVFIDSVTIALADHGLESGNPWPYGDIWLIKNIKDTLKWQKVSKYKSFYHSVAQGDLNNDGKFDLIGLHMGSYNDWKGTNGLHPYLQQNDESFIDGTNVIENTSFLGENTGQGSILIKDIMGDSRPEIIKGQYGSDPSNPYAFAIFGYDNVTGKYKFIKKPTEKGVYSKSEQGSTSIQSADFNNDGKLDLAIASEGAPNGLIQIWNGKGNGDFTPGQILTYLDAIGTDTSDTFREFQIADIDNDGWLDIFVNPFHFGTKFRINPGPRSPTNPNGNKGSGVRLNNIIWKNDKGIFNTLTNDLKVPGVYPGFLKGGFVNNKLKFFGFESMAKAFILNEITVTFCKDLVKPQFNNSKLNFCDGDSLKLSISNVNLGDTIKWHSGNKIEVSNTKLFKESLKIFATRTDSLGCTISSDTISITKNTIPTLPIVKDTVFCQNIISSTLLATGISGNTITWYGTNATGGTGTNNAVVASTIDTTTKSYYVSQINNTSSCESPRAKITVKINPAPVSPSVKDTSYCNSINADTLKATPLANHSLSWYGTSATGGTASTFGAKPNTTTSGTFSYYVSQFNNATGCEGPRAKIGVTIIPLPNPPTVKDTSYCNNALIDTLRVIPTTGNTLLWYGTSATGGTATNTAIKPSTTVIGTSSFYLSQITTATGCESLRAKLNVTVNPIPSAPIISRDTINNLVSNVTTRNSWYKDGTLITDTTQKFKPTSPGSYTVKTTQNGCVSAMSSPYYYLVTDIVRLNNGEFIKLTPNPFKNYINFDFVVKGQPRLNIEVFSAATGAKVAARIGVTAGSRLTFNELNPGVYFVRVASPDLKVSHQFKMIKL
jgi:hypothetical protein